MTKKMTDAEMAEFYEDPKNREPAGPLFSRRRGKVDWVEDDSMTKEERMEKFESLEPAKVVGPEKRILELKKERDRLRAGLFLLYKKYEEANIHGLFESQDELVSALEGDIVMIMDDFDITEWAGQQALEDFGKIKYENIVLKYEKDQWQDVTLINGPAKGFKFSLQEAPKRLVVGEAVYERIDDPETEEFLGGYSWVSDGKS